MPKIGCSKEEIIRVFVNPDDLRKWADEMETKMAKTVWGQDVWNYPVYGKDGLVVRLTADQSWFHEKEYWSKRK